MSPPADRIESLDSIRGLAALAVLLGHSAGAFEWPSQWTNLPIVNLLFDGRSAVTMFFVLSGFVLARPYLSNDSEKALHIPTFYLRRITRIWIPWFCVFGLSILAKFCFFEDHPTIPPETKWLKGFWHAPLTLPDVVRQCAFQLHDASRLLLPQDWSLGVELKGSALIPILILWARRNIFFLIAAGAALLVTIPTGEYYVSFVAGVFLARYSKQLQASVRALSFWQKLSFLGLGILLYQSRLAIPFLPSNNIVEKAIWSVGTVGCLLIILVSLCSHRAQKSLSHSVPVFFGKISYSVYLIQFLVLLCILPPFISWINAWGISEARLIFAIGLSFVLVVNTAIAIGTYYIIEIPAIRFGAHLTRCYQKWVQGKHCSPEAKLDSNTEKTCSN